MLVTWKKETVNWYSNLNSVSILIFKISYFQNFNFKLYQNKSMLLFSIFYLCLCHLLVSKMFCADFVFFFLHSIIALNKQHDIQCLYLINIMSKSKMQTTTADAMVNHPNAWFSWLKPAAAIEATISPGTDGARTHCLF